ncbi:hypothetical protein PAXINDRAFT_79868 [Paxillus involutus ATCC 200175]|uniref:Uncharacterized protein n=1 Tax=Paxillus involutus ATCC 200175 TaxID=664439 RepID=A0A0C9TUV6_PAXIN|nr:hypothetical protein PAXINDRAFT_79868 [Paxillus involutus ATCC 200175]
MFPGPTENQRPQWTCVCLKYGSGEPHEVSSSTWNRHFEQAATDDEKNHIRAARLLGKNARLLPNTTEALIALAKRGRETTESLLSVGRRKKAKTRDSSVSEQPDQFPSPSPPTVHTPSFPPPPPPSPPPPERMSPPPELQIPRRIRPNFDIDRLAQTAVLPKLRETMEYIVSLRNASLEDAVSKLDDAALQRIRHPPQATLQIDDLDIRHSIGTYLALEHSSQDAYERVRHSHTVNYPDHLGMLSFSEVERIIAQYTGVEKIQNDMCPKTCLAYTGPYEPLELCPTCAMSRWNQEKLRASNGRNKVAARKFTTITLASQLQARFRHPQTAREMQYLHERTQQVLEHLRETGEIPVIDDVVMGWDFLGAVLDGDIKPDDIVVMVSLDGAQLYQSKESDCWIYVWVLLNMSPDKRYKKINVIPGGFIPGPNKPKNVDSFLFPGLHHVSALQKEGLTIWDASRRDDLAHETVFR